MNEPQLLRLAAEHVRLGAHGEAEAIYRRIIASGSTNPQVLVNLSMICALTQRPAQRLQLLDQALQLAPRFSPAWFNRGMALLPERQYAEALRCFERSLAADPEQPLAQAGCGLCLGMLAEIDAAIEAYRRAVALGLDAAEQSFFHLGRELYRNHRLDEAIRVFRAGLDAHGDHADSLLLLALAFTQSGRREEAAEVFLYLLSIDPQNDEALSHYGRLLKDLGQLDAAEELFQQALVANPTSSHPHNELGLLRMNAGRIDAALHHYEQARQLAPGWSAPLLNIATALRMRGDLEGCLARLSQALADFPDDFTTFQVLMLNLSLGGERYASRILSTGQEWWARYRQAHALGQPRLLPAANAPIRVGIISSNFHGHSISRFLLSYLDHHNRRLVRIEAIPTTPLHPDVEQGLRQRQVDVLSIANLPDPEARRHIRERRYDLILDTDAYEPGSALPLLCERCAPVQCHWIGYQASLALDTIDHFLGDEETAAAELQEQFRERLWRLPRPWLACTPHTSIPIAASTRLGEAQIVLGSFNQIGKVREHTLLHWARALAAVPHSVLVIKNRVATDAGAQARISTFLGDRGIAPERLRFRGHEPDDLRHLLAYNDIDIALDTTPWSSATTGFDALSMGVPLVAIRGRCLAARMGSSLVKGIGRPEWVAASPEEFGEIVARLAAQVEPLRAQRAALQQEVLNGPLYDPADLAHHLDQALLAMVQRRRERP